MRGAKINAAGVRLRAGSGCRTQDLIGFCHTEGGSLLVCAFDTRIPAHMDMPDLLRDPEAVTPR
jgi:hypothetical protein